MRHEEEAHVEPVWREVGSLRARRIVESERVEGTVPREVERMRRERVPAGEGDSGQIETLPDGSVSIPLFEEEVVLSKRTVLRERVIIRKEVVTEPKRIDTHVRRERVEIDTSDLPAGTVRGSEGLEPGTRRLVQRPPDEDRAPTETRPFFLTSEFLALVVAVVALAFTMAVNDRFNASLGWPLIAAVVGGYLLSRGFAKGGAGARPWRRF